VVFILIWVPAEQLRLICEPAPHSDVLILRISLLPETRTKLASIALHKHCINNANRFCSCMGRSCNAHPRKLCVAQLVNNVQRQILSAHAFVAESTRWFSIISVRDTAVVETWPLMMVRIHLHQEAVFQDRHPLAEMAEALAYLSKPYSKFLPCQKRRSLTWRSAIRSARQRTSCWVKFCKTPRRSVQG
jgi:hypothetical protein